MYCSHLRQALRPSSAILPSPCTPCMRARTQSQTRSNRRCSTMGPCNVCESRYVRLKRSPRYPFIGVRYRIQRRWGKPLAAASSRSRHPFLPPRPRSRAILAVGGGGVEENWEMDSRSNGVFERRGSLGRVERNYYMGRLWGIVGWDNIDLSSLLIQTLMESNYVIVRGEVSSDCFKYFFLNRSVVIV